MLFADYRQESRTWLWEKFGKKAEVGFGGSYLFGASKSVCVETVSFTDKAWQLELFPQLKLVSLL